MIDSASTGPTNIPCRIKIRKRRLRYAAAPRVSSTEAASAAAIVAAI